MPSWVSGAPKDIDLLCIGRIEKFEGLEEIWNFIRNNVPSSKFVLAGRASAGEISRLRKIGIDHRGIVSEEEKLKLYSRAKVFIFPSLFEGFGLAVTEAIAAGLSIIAWKLPVFEERFGKEGSNHLRLVEIGETSKFAQESLLAMSKYKEARDRKNEYKKSAKMTWDDIGKSVSLLLGRLQ
jgi:glycosyltransferase involved in cell wall biosynthesis